MPSKPSLKGPVLELIRAKEHLNSLAAELRMFHTSNPTEVSIKVNPANGLNVIHVKLPMPPGRLGLIAGDVFFALRAAIDHLMCNSASLQQRRPGNELDSLVLGASTRERENEGRTRDSVRP